MLKRNAGAMVEPVYKPSYFELRRFVHKRVWNIAHREIFLLSLILPLAIFVVIDQILQRNSNLYKDLLFLNVFCRL